MKGTENFKAIPQSNALKKERMNDINTDAKMA
jgi:hypothetical protein